MLSKNQVELIKRNLQKTYTGRCTITEVTKVKEPNRSTSTKEVETVKDEPCRLSYEKITQANSNGMNYNVSQTIKLFIDPKVNISPGSKITITQCGEKESFKASGKPARYDTHQEVLLTLEKDYS